MAYVSCVNKEKLTDEKDYAAYLVPQHFHQQEAALKKETAFWADRLKQDTASYVNLMELGRCLLAEFRLTASIEKLRAGDSLLKAASARLNHREPEILYAMTQNSITRHRFKEAAVLHQDAARAGGNQYTLCLLSFDVNMELGHYQEAWRQLQQLKDKESFDYMIRLAKWEDHQGKLDKAILLMEKARQKTGISRSAVNWVQSNLGDMYGHAGRVRESYQCYLDVLKNEPADFHCLQGIAWIAFSHDGDPAAAQKIISFIRQYYPEPGLCLQLASFAASEGRRTEQEKMENHFLDQLSHQQYGDMYNQYLIELLLEKDALKDSALQMAKREMQHRFTPETADRYAWALFCNADTANAYQFAKAYVYRRSFEPIVQFHTAQIFAAAGDRRAAKELLLSCRETAFELGPVKMKTVDALLAAWH